MDFSEETPHVPALERSAFISASLNGDAIRWGFVDRIQNIEREVFNGTERTIFMQRELKASQMAATLSSKSGYGVAPILSLDEAGEAAVG